jgi:hypothetical protein
MGKSYPAKTSFNGGVQSPLLRGLVDAPKGNSSFQASENMVPLKHGPLVRRGGTELIVQTNAFGGDGKKAQLVPFQYNDTDSYVLLFTYSGGTGKLNVYKDKGVILDTAVSTTVSNISSGSPFTLTVASSTGFLTGDDVVLNVTSPANSELDGKLSTIYSVPTGTSVGLDPRFLPFHQTGATTGTLNKVYSIPIPYDGDDMFASDGTFRLDVVQYNDVMYIVHPDYHPRVLTRSADDSWSITALDLNNGPFLPDNTEKKKKLYLSSWRKESGITGYEYCTVRSVLAGDREVGTPIDIFDTDDVQAVDSHGLPITNGTDTVGNGRSIAIFVAQYTTKKYGEPKDYRWHYLRIVKWVSNSEVWVEKPTDDADFTKGDYEEQQRYNVTSINGGVDMRPSQWALGSFSKRTGFPSVVEIHDGRLCMGNNTAELTTIHFSEIGGFDTTSSTWKTTDYDGQVYDDLGFAVSIGGGNQSPIQWISSSSDGVLVGSYSSEGVIGVSDSSDGFVPGGVSYRKSTSVGSKSIQPIMIDQSTLFVSRTGRRIHELTYNLASGGQKSPDLTLLAEHVTLTGVIDFAWQREPLSTLWLVLADGKLVGFTFDQNNEISAWHQHSIAGEDDSTYNSGLGSAESMVRSVAVIPATDGLSDEVWIFVDREASSINYGAPTTRSQDLKSISGTIEVLSPIFSDQDDIKDSRHLDSFLSISSAIVSKTTSDTSGTVAGLTDGGIYLLTNTVTSGTLNIDTDNQYFLVDGGQFKSIAGSVIDFGATFTADTQTTSTTFTGLDIMLGKTIRVYADGRDLGTQVINPVVGVVTLDNGAYGANVTFGYDYTSYVELQNLEGGSIQNLNQGKTKRLKAVMVRLVDSLGLKYGKSSTDMYEYQFDEDDALSDFRTLKSGDYVLSPWPGGYDKSGTIRLQGDGPYPLQIQLVVAEMDTAEMFTSVR